MSKAKSQKKPVKAKAKKNKKVKKNALPKTQKIEGKLIGKISHYFSDIEVGIIKLSAPLSNGDEIRIIGGQTTDFNQKVTSMQLNHKELKKAKKGDAIGLKTSEKVREGYQVYKP